MVLLPFEDSQSSNPGSIPGSATSGLRARLTSRKISFLRQPLNLHARGLQEGLNSGYKTVELGDQVLMLSSAALDAVGGRHAEAVTAHLLFPLELG